MRKSSSEKSLSPVGYAVFCGLVLAVLAPSLEAQEAPTTGVREGNLYPDFLLPDIDGNIERLSDYRGKKILLFHFASW